MQELESKLRLQGVKVERTDVSPSLVPSLSANDIKITHNNTNNINVASSTHCRNITNNINNTSVNNINSHNRVNRTNDNSSCSLENSNDSIADNNFNISNDFSTINMDAMSSICDNGISFSTNLLASVPESMHTDSVCSSHITSSDHVSFCNDFLNITSSTNNINIVNNNSNNCQFSPSFQSDATTTSSLDNSNLFNSALASTLSSLHTAQLLMPSADVLTRTLTPDALTREALTRDALSSDDLTPDDLEPLLANHDHLLDGGPTLNSRNVDQSLNCNSTSDGQPLDDRKVREFQGFSNIDEDEASFLDVRPSSHILLFCSFYVFHWLCWVSLVLLEQTKFLTIHPTLSISLLPKHITLLF